MKHPSSTRTALAAAIAVALAPAAPDFALAQELWGPEVELEVDLALSNPPQTLARLGTAVAATPTAIVVGSPGLTAQPGGHPGSVLVFEPVAGDWAHTAVFESPVNDAIGGSVAVSGDWLAYGAPDVQTGGRVYLHLRVAPGSWLPTPDTLGGSLAGQTVDFGDALALDGERLIVGDPSAPAGAAPVAGRAWAFRWNQANSSWIEDGELAPPVPTEAAWFGASVDVSGDLAVVGEPRYGAGHGGRVHVFRRVAGAWSWQTELSPPAGLPAGFCGQAVAIDGDRVLFGCPQATAGGQDEAGAAYVYERQALGIWTLQATLLHPQPMPDDAFGLSVALDGSLALVGVPWDDVGTVLPATDDGTVQAYRAVGGAWSHVGTYFSGTFLDPSMRCGSSVALAAGVAAWGCPAAELDGWDQAGRAFVVSPPLFADGFESGDTAAWTSTMP